MASLPSSIAFASFVAYSPRGTSGISQFSRDVTYAVKQDKFLRPPHEMVRAIPFLAERVRARLDEYPFLKAYFGPKVVLVPAPRSSPLTKGALWPALRICEAMSAEGLGGRVETHLQRMKPVRKSAFAAPGERPGAQEHFDSVSVGRQGLLDRPTAITLVDDVVTRGATFVGLFPHLSAAFPEAVIRCFALVRTVSGGEIERVRDPIEGKITFEAGVLRRRP